MEVGLETQRDAYLADGWIVVGQRTVLGQRNADGTGYDTYIRYKMAAPWDTCLKPLYVSEKHPILNTYCLMDKGHRGRHASVVFYCDECGKARRGDTSSAGYSDEEVTICWFCKNIGYTTRSKHERHRGERRQKSIFCN